MPLTQVNASWDSSESGLHGREVVLCWAQAGGTELRGRWGRTVLVHRPWARRGWGWRGWPPSPTLLSEDVLGCPQLCWRARPCEPHLALPDGIHKHLRISRGSQSPSPPLSPPSPVSSRWLAEILNSVWGRPLGGRCSRPSRPYTLP